MTPSLVSYERVGEVARVTLNNPPVNAFSLAMRQQLVSALERAQGDADIVGVVLAGRGRYFSAGGDIREFGTPLVTAAPRLTLDVMPMIEAMRCPVVAAIHGGALGGGIETAMACHYRVAAADAIIALPEVSLGVIPLSGTQRLPRLLPLQDAIDLILSGKRCRAEDFAEGGLFDRIVASAEAPFDAARDLVVKAAHEGASLPLVSRRPIFCANPQEVLRRAAARLDSSHATAAERLALEAIAAAVDSPDFETGLARANLICERLLASDEARASADRLVNR